MCGVKNDYEVPKANWYIDNVNILHMLNNCHRANSDSCRIDVYRSFIRCSDVVSYWNL